MALWLLLLLSLWEGGGSQGGGGKWWSGGGVLKNGASKKTWVYPIILDCFTSELCECSPAVLSGGCCLAGASAANTATARRLAGTKTYRAAAFFPDPHFLQYKSTFSGRPKNLQKIRLALAGMWGAGVESGDRRNWRPRVKN